MTVDRHDIVAGTLWISERGGQSATFRYAEEYLTRPDSYDLDPTLPRSSGLFHAPAGKVMFGAFAEELELQLARRAGLTSPNPASCGPLAGMC